ncbi:hypothetical protein KVT40_007898 [Elsinoe batatas]|uniref:Zn(2)-C6 fungal-type domain-containing protein n=1 Tax=Elsinoe batatas TaxID=2601811 RepID=A0A8K0KZG0_9PEZI|nr:hypothetical protein KVT40_007898 [Elsinoe batatas]
MLSPAIIQMETLSDAPTSNPTIRRSSRACDACRRRKVRCNGATRCQQCSHLDIKCVYTAAPSKRSRKAAAPRGTIIQACRTDVPLPPPPAQNQNHNHLSAASPASLFSDISSPTSGISPRSGPRHSFSAGPIDPNFFYDLLPEYIDAVYPVNPVVTPDECRSCISRMYSDEEALCFLYVYAAVTISLSHIDRGADAVDQIMSLVRSCLDHRRPLTPQNMPPSILRVMTSVFLEICLMNLYKSDLALFYLNEAIMQLPMLHITDAEFMGTLSHTERCRRERLYWECLIHERFAAIVHERAIILDPLPELPAFDPSIDFSIHQGWIYTVQTFCMIDRDFVGFWLKHREPDPEWLRLRHRELEDSQWHMEVSMLAAMQQADIIVTRQWLRTVLWQIAIRSMLLTSSTPGSPHLASAPLHSPADPSGPTKSTSSLSLTFPLTLSHELKSYLSHFTTLEIGVHGSGILHKLFEIANAIVDVVTQLPDASEEDTRERVRDLLFLKKLIFGFPRTDRLHRRILEEKFEMVRGLGRWDDFEGGTPVEGQAEEAMGVRGLVGLL